MPVKQDFNIYEEARGRLRSARRVFVLTGAGVSAESGVPTFRDAGNSAFWKGMPFDVIASAEMVARDLPAVWEWFDYRRDALETCLPNAAHTTLARWQERFPRLTLATQNVDGLHATAGSRDVLELHGNVWRARCISCGGREDLRQIRREERPPVCRACGDSMRPDVVLFGEILPMGVFAEATVRATECDVCLVVGTSAIVYPAAGLPLAARDAGAFLIEINPEPTPLSELCDLTIRGRAGDVLPRLDS